MNLSLNKYQVEFDDAVEKFGDMVYRICVTITGNTEDAKDAFQDTFLRLVKHHHEITSEEHLKAWLIRVAGNCAKTTVTSPWNKRTQGFNEEQGQEAVYEQEENLLLAELQSLPENYALVLYLFYYEEYSIKEIGHLLDKKENTVKTLLDRGRKLLKKKLEEGGAFHE